MVQQNKLLIYHRKLLGRKGHVIEGCIIISVPVTATNVPLGFRGDFGHGQGDSGHQGRHRTPLYRSILWTYYM